jgi:putative peptidoglycan lipid II flippase
MSDDRRLVRASVLVAGGTTLSRLTGFARVAALAYALGFTRLTDAYLLANTTPNMVYELLIGGVLTATLVRVFVECVERDDDDGISAVVTVATVALAVITAVGVLAAPAIVHLYSLRVHSPVSADQRAVAVALLRLFMPQMLFYGVVALTAALLNAHRRFAVPAYAPVLNNLLVIGVLLAAPHIVGHTPDVADARARVALLLLLGVGTTAGIVTMTIPHVVAAARSGTHLRWRFDWRHPAVVRMARLSGWTFGYVATNQVALVAVYWLAYAHRGGLSAYQAAFMFFQLPHSLVVVSLMTTVGVELSSAAARGDHDEFRRRVRFGARANALLILPAAAGYLALSRPIVTTLLHHGALSAGASIRTGDALTAFAVGLVPFSWYLFTVRGFYALGDTKTPFTINVFENAANIVLAFLLEPLLGVAGLALAFSIAYGVAAVVAHRALTRRVGGILDAPTRASLIRLGVGAVAAGLAARGASEAVGGGAPARTAVGLVAGIAAYALALMMLRSDELSSLRSGLGKRDVQPSDPSGGRTPGRDGVPPSSPQPTVPPPNLPAHDEERYR